MTTPIKFRGFRVDGKGWVEGFYWASLDPCSTETRWRGHFIHNGCNIETPVPIHLSSLGMFTGLTDKNGKEIYGAIGEKGGDRITMGDFDLFVKFENCSFRVFSNTHKDSDGSPLRWGELSRIWDLCWHDRVEIIGNQWGVDNGN